MNDQDLKYFKGKLNEEMATLLEELKSVGKMNPDNSEDWIAKPEEMDTLASDTSEVADGYEAYGENAAVLKELELRLSNVKRALKKIEDGNYGVCEISGEPIEKDRLEANPAAATCKKHMN